MSRDNTYFLISTAGYETIPALASFLKNHGPIYHPAIDDDEPVKMTPKNATIKVAYEVKYPGMNLSIYDDRLGDFRWGVEYEDSTHQLLTVPNMSQKELKEVLAKQKALGRDGETAILPHNQMRHYKQTGELPDS